MKTEKVLEDAIAHMKSHGGRIVEKKGFFWNFLHYVIMVLTLGRNRSFLKGYYTTIGPWVGVPTNWDDWPEVSRAAVIRHETVHVQQCKRMGFGNVYVGLIPFSLLYLLVPFPIGFAWFRWRFEREAYAVGIRVALSLPIVREDDRERQIDHVVEQLTSGSYAWTATIWPGKKRVRKWFEENV